MDSTIKASTKESMYRVGMFGMIIRRDRPIEEKMENFPDTSPAWAVAHGHDVEVPSCPAQIHEFLEE